MQSFMLREVDLPVMLIVDLSLPSVVQHSYTGQYQQITCSVHDDHCLTRSKFNYLLTEMITPQIYHNIMHVSGSCHSSLEVM